MVCCPADTANSPWRVRPQWQSHPPAHPPCLDRCQSLKLRIEDGGSHSCLPADTRCSRCTLRLQVCCKGVAFAEWLVCNKGWPHPAAWSSRVRRTGRKQDCSRRRPPDLARRSGTAEGLDSCERQRDSESATLAPPQGGAVLPNQPRRPVARAAGHIERVSAASRTRPSRGPQTDSFCAPTAGDAVLPLS